MIDLEYTIDTRSPEERAPCRCAECEAAGECERRNVALVAALRAAIEITEGTVRDRAVLAGPEARKMGVRP